MYYIETSNIIRIFFIKIGSRLMHITQRTVSILFIIIFIISCKKTTDSEPVAVTFPDINFETVIRETLNKLTGDITADDLESITMLNGENRNISVITGIEFCTNLQFLYLATNQIGDISALNNLTNLLRLDLWENNIYNIGVLGNLTNLQFLILGYNQISDISILSQLTNLTYLTLHNNQISNISSLSNLTNLQSLYLGENQISDISSLSSLISLRELYLFYNQISNIEPLVQNSGIGSGDLVDLCNNPLSYNSSIIQLEARGVTVYYGDCYIHSSIGKTDLSNTGKCFLNTKQN